MRFQSSFLPIAATLLASTPLAAQVVTGRVLDAATGEGVPQAEVKAVSAEGRDLGHARTASDGAFEIRLRVPGAVRLQAQRTGYRATTTGELPIGARETVGVEVRLSASAVVIEPLRVTARAEPPRRRSLELTGFYDRERLGIGQYLRREDIEKHSNQDLAQVLSRVPGAAIRYLNSKQYIYFPRNGDPFNRLANSGSLRRQRDPPRNDCLPRLFLDGTRVTYDDHMDINSIVDPDQVEAIEVFRGPSEIPVQYNDNNSQCGVILIWTKKEP